MIDQENQRNKDTMLSSASINDHFADSEAKSDLENQTSSATQNGSKTAWSSSRLCRVGLFLLVVAFCATVVAVVVSRGNANDASRDVGLAVSSNETLENVDIETELEAQANSSNAVVDQLVVIPEADEKEVESVDEISLLPSMAPSGMTLTPSDIPTSLPTVTESLAPSLLVELVAKEAPTASDSTPFPTTTDGVRIKTAAPATPSAGLVSPTPAPTAPSTSAPTLAQSPLPTTIAPSLAETPVPTTLSPVAVTTTSPTKPNDTGDKEPESTIFPTIAPTEKGSTSAPTEPPPTLSPTTAFPTYAPTLNLAPLTAEMRQLQTALLPISRNPDALSDRGSAEFLAMKWLHDMTTQSSTLSVRNLVNNPNRLQQRFAMAVLDISVQGRGRRTPRFARNSLDECSWLGVSCSEGKVVKIAWVGDRSLKGILPEDLGLLTGLTHLDLAENDVGGTIPAGLYKLTSLRYLYLHDNRLTGPISEDISQLNSLEKLFLGDNQLSGPFPKGLGSRGLGAGNARRLKFLHLGRNNLSGPIPEKLNLRNLYYLDMSQNSFSGEIPVDWYEGGNTLYWIRHLYLNNNELSGEITTTFPSIGAGRLMQLDLSHNNFSGVFPGNWVPRNMLEALEIQGNNFSSMDEELCMVSVFNGGEMTALRSDCFICTCGWPYCLTPRCS